MLMGAAQADQATTEAPSTTSVNPPQASTPHSMSHKRHHARRRHHSGGHAARSAEESGANVAATAETSASGRRVITNGPVPDTPENRALHGGPNSQAGRNTKPKGN